MILVAPFTVNLILARPERLHSALERFVRLPPSANELRERLDQLRALDAGMRIDVAIVTSVPLGVDTPEELAKARKLLGG